ncbi:MAG: methylenetetrahydrofolate reductase [NAD(P)H] [Ruminococcaceae bacterium]|nr:methylenetetrahydrofolate reductase [NAD(P)H] [Oscillospiraceae bacterium]
MNISKLFETKKVVYSFEIFPPKADSGVDTVYNTIEALGDLSPDYISVTYGAGGSVTENRTAELSSLVKSKLKIEPMAHLSCITASKENIDSILEDLKNRHVSNVLALRGDPPKSGIAVKPLEERAFKYATDLVAYIKEKGDFNVVGACYPEKHTEALTLDEDILHLKEKVDAGVGHLVTQLFFDNTVFYNFMEKVAGAGINVPVTAGIMPVTSKNQINRMVNMCGATIPTDLMKIIDKYGDNPISMRDAGIVYAAQQISDLIANGVKGIHLYTMNNPAVARKITLLIENLME